MSAICSDYIVLFKSVSENEDDDAYSNAFLSAGFQVTLVPVLDFEFENLDVLLLKLNTSNDYSGIIYSSPRVVTGVGLSVRNESNVLEKWKNHKHFVVGEKTAQMVENLGFSSCGKESGNAKNLVKSIASDQYEKPFLYPKGSLTKDNFKLELKENGILVDELIIYKTVPHPDLENYIINIKPNLHNKSVYFVYFSPSGVNFTLPLLKTLEFDLHKIKFIAIGPTTEKGLQENGLKVAATSSKPDPEALLNTILQYKTVKNCNESQ